MRACKKFILNNHMGGVGFYLYLTHTGLTRVSSIRFLLFEIKRVLVFNSIIIYFTDLFILYLFIQNAYANKKVLKKVLQIRFNGSNCDQKSQLSGILTEPLNPSEGFSK